MLEKYKFNAIVYLGILAVCLGVFSPAFQAGFVNWDDPFYTYENAVLLENSWAQPFAYLKSIFSNMNADVYTPITILSFAIEKGIYGLENPMWWHLDNILLHSINTLLVFLILAKLGMDRFTSILVGLLFAVHPMRVEAVVWLTARKDMLFALFFF